MFGEKTKWLGEKKVWKLAICAKDLSYMFLPFDPLIALLGTYPKETAGSLGKKHNVETGWSEGCAEWKEAW